MTRRLLFLVLAASIAASAITIPRPAPNLGFITPAGQVTLSQFKGKVIVLAFVMTTCEDCQRILQVLNPIQNELRPRGLQVIAGAFNPEAGKQFESFADHVQPTYPLGLIQPDRVEAFTQVTPAMKPTAPIIVIIDRTGMVRAQFLGSDKIFQGNASQNLRAEFQKYLK